MSGIAGEDEQQQIRYLEDASKVVEEQALYMKRAIDGDSLQLALNHATAVLRELRTNLLTPKNYYELFMKILDELRALEEYFNLLQQSGQRAIAEIYEQVQICANVVPRLYLLCCVGGVYITSKEAPAKDILKDLVQFTKGVQHPMRGLFLRYYLTLVSKNKLPDVGSPYEGIGGDIEDAYTFLLQNFVETNRLWVRLQTQGETKNKKKREKERQDLRILVGANLVRLSQLEGLTVEEYKTVVLPKILEEVMSCKDNIAQTYLMDCVIQVFPDEFHLATLGDVLLACSSLREKVNVRSILESLMNRLASHSLANSGSATGGSDLPSSTKINSFNLFNDCIATLIEGRSNMSLTETLRLQTVLTNFALKCHSTRIDYVAHCLSTSGSLIAKTDFLADCAAEQETGQSTPITVEITGEIENLLSAPLSSLSLQVLEIPSFGTLMTYLPWSNWKEVAATLLKSIISSNSPLSEVSQVEQIFQMISPLLKDKDLPTNGKASAEEDEEIIRVDKLSLKFKEEQYLVARMPHLMRSDDTDTLLQLLKVARTAFAAGGSSRMQFTFSPLVFAAISLTRRVHKREKDAAIPIDEDSEESVESQLERRVSPPKESTRKVFHFIIEVITALATSHPEPALQLFLQAAQAADDFGYHAISYEFVKEALLIYETDITDSKVQVNMLTLTIGTLLQCRCFPKEDYEALITKVAQYANKLLKKSDQCRMVSLCSHLFSPTHPVGGEEPTEADKEDEGGDISSSSSTARVPYSDCDRLLECMQRALKVASVCNPNLFVDILDKYVYYFEHDNPIINVRYLSGLIALINEQSAGAEPLNPAVEAHYKNTLDYIRSRQNAPETSEKFAQVNL